MATKKAKALIRSFASRERIVGRDKRVAFEAVYCDLSTLSSTHENGTVLGEGGRVFWCRTWDPLLQAKKRSQRRGRIHGILLQDKEPTFVKPARRLGAVGAADVAELDGGVDDGGVRALGLDLKNVRK